MVKIIQHANVNVMASTSSESSNKFRYHIDFFTSMKIPFLSMTLFLSIEVRENGQKMTSKDTQTLKYGLRGI